MKDLIIILSNIFYNDYIIFIIKILYWLVVLPFLCLKDGAELEREREKKNPKISECHCGRHAQKLFSRSIES